MHQLNGDCRRVEAFGRHLQRFARGVDQQGPQALAAAEHGIAHGRVQPLRGLGSIGQGTLQGAFDPLA